MAVLSRFVNCDPALSPVNEDAAVCAQDATVCSEETTMLQVGLNQAAGRRRSQSWFHREEEGGNTCSTSDISSSDCLRAARDLLPSGQHQGRTNLISGTWDHVPNGCSMMTGGDWAAHYGGACRRRRCHANRNDGRFSLLCTGRRPAGQSAFVGCFIDDANRDLEQGPGASVYGNTVASCTVSCNEYSHFAMQNNGQCFCGNAYSTEPQYSERPESECGTACAGEHSGHCGGPWRNAVYIVGSPPPSHIYLEAEGSNFCSTASVSSSDCLQATRDLLLAGQHQGRTDLSSGTWGHVPNGCSMQTRGDNAAHYGGVCRRRRCNSNRNDGSYSLVCTAPHVHTEGASGCHSGESISEGDCLNSVRYAVERAGHHMSRTSLQSGSWNHVPLGCSTMSGGDWAAHYGSCRRRRCHNNQNDGRFSPVCVGSR